MRIERFPRGGPASALVLACAAACILAAPGVLAQLAPQSSPLESLVKAPAGFVATIAPQPLTEVAGEVDPAVLAAADAFRAAHGPAWSFFVDRRSGGMALVEGQGIAWIPGAGNALDPASFGTVDAARLESLARGLMATYPALFAVPSAQLELAPEATRQLGDEGQFWNVAFRQVAGGVPVANTHVVFRVSHGNLVQFGVDRVYPVAAELATAPQLSREQARSVLGGYLGGLTADDTFSDDGTLLWVLRGTADQVGWRGPIGSGWHPELAWRFVIHRDGLLSNWEALVDAVDGEILRFVDANDYLSVVRASVYTRTNCSDPANCVPGDIPETPVTMPHAVIDFVGGTCSGDGCYSNSAGAFDYPAGAVSGVTSLQGRYFRLNDGCGPIAASAVAPGNIDLGTSDPSPLGTNTDCAFATRESEPDSGPVANGTGDTHSARTMYYHLNLINEKSRYYLPGNDWLQGADGSDVRPQIVTNAPGACNAFWSGGIDTLLFMQTTRTQGCNNTGEGPDIGLHEFGHGLDQHDGTGTAPESATGEAMGDSFALLQGQASCIGVGLRLVDPSDPSWGHTAGYGSRSRLCSGVRELDYTRYCRVPPSPLPLTGLRPEGCVAPNDPDAPNGARSGPTPPSEPAGTAGTPARWNHMIASAPAGVADGFSNFYSCGGPELTGCAGPLNHGCHCESLIASQANWDLARLLIADEFGGDVYSVPPGPTEVSGWQYLDRLWYLTRDLAVSGYSVVGNPATDPATSVVTNGCGATDWYSTYRLIDDDNGNLADGTPHADLLHAAFDLHGIACGTAAEAANQATGCPAPLVSPQLGSCGGNAPVHLDWGTAAGAEEVRVLRNTIGCDFGFTPLDVVPGDQGFFIDEEVAPGVPYYYAVQPVGANPSCYGQVSNCLAVTPQACAATALPAPGSVTATASVANQVEVSWAGVAGAGSYKVVRTAGGCASGGADTTVAVVTAPGTSFTDTHGINGGSVYGYRVFSSETACASCTSEASACVEVEASGDCFAAPQFAGVERVVSGTGSQCSLEVEWAPGTARCGTSLTYTVHRSTEHGFTPSASNAIATGVTGTSFTDGGVLGGTEYTYVVRAVDASGNTDDNTVRRSERAVGPLGSGGSQFTDDAGDTGTVKLQARGGIVNTWSVRAGEGVGGSAAYATTPAGNYPDDSCMALESETIYLGAAPSLSFRSKWAIEPAWDGAIVQVATEDSGFSQWTKLEVGYPGVMGGAAGDTACGDPGLADGQPAFNGNSLGQYLDFSSSLLPWAGQAVRVRFLFGSDAGTNDLGLFVDDLVVDDVREASQCTSTAANQAPVAVDDEARTVRDAAVSIAVLANDSDPDGDALAVVDHGFPDHGTATIEADGTVTYQPDPGFGGFDGFDYVVGDGRGGEASARVSVQVTCPAADGFADDFEPSAEAGWSVDTAANGLPTSLTWQVLPDLFAHSASHSYFSDATTLDVKDDRLVSPAVTLTSTSRLIFWHRYSLEAGFDGGVLEVSTDGGATWVDVVAGGGVFVEGGYNGLVAAGFGSPIAGRDAWTGASQFINAMNRVEVHLGAFAGTGVKLRWRLAGDPLAIGATPGQGWWIDDVELTDPGLVDCNLAPLAEDDSAVTAQDTAVTVDVLANDSDPNGDPLTVTAVEAPAHGSATIGAGGAVTYTPDAGFTGVERFAYTVSDGEFSGTATIEVTVEADPDEPRLSRAQGSGRVPDGVGTGKFAVSARTGTTKGRVSYDGPSIDVEGTVGSLTFPTATSAEITGTCELATGAACTYRIDVQDGGASGAGDHFALEVKDALGTTVHTVSGNLTSGNLQVR